MDPIVEGRINAIRGEVAKSALEPEHKDALQARLDHAATCSNGTPDKLAAIAQAVADGIAHEVRTEIRAPGRIRRIVEEAIEEHEVRSEERLAKTLSDALTSHLSACPVRAADQQAAALGPLAARLGAIGRAFSALSIEGRIITAIIFLWAVERFGIENVVLWIKSLFA